MSPIFPSGSQFHRGDPVAAVDFLMKLRPGGPWTLTALKPDDPSGAAPTRTFTDPGEAKDWIAAHINVANIYFQPSVMKTAVSKRASKSDVGEVPFLHVDLDCDKLGMPIDEGKQLVLAELHDLAEPGPPTIIVDSGGGIQALWRLEDPFKARFETELDLAEDANRFLLEKLTGGDPGTHDVTRLLRLPFTVNLPNAKKRQRGRVPVLATSIEINDTRYLTFELLFAAKQPKAARLKLEIAAPEFVDDLGALADEHGLPDRLVTIIRDGRLAEPKANDDSRSAWLFDAVCGLIRHNVPNEVILGILLDPAWAISESVLERPEHDQERYAVHQIESAHARIKVNAAADFADVLDPEWLETTSGDDADDDDRGQQRHQVGGLTFVRASEVKQQPISWLWPNRIAIGKLTCLAGEPDQGKSQVTVHIAATVTNGGSWPDGGTAPKGSVVFLSAEDDFADTVTPRLAAAGADLDRILLVDMLLREKNGRRMFSLASDLDRLTALVKENPDIRLVIIDPISAYMGSSKTVDSFRNTDVRGVLAPLSEWGARHGIAVLFVTHFNKVNKGSAVGRVMDSLAFTAISRSYWAIVPEMSDGRATGRKLMLKGKQNIAGTVPGLAYRIEGVDLTDGIRTSRVVWDGEVAMTADEAFGQETGQQLSPKLMAAINFIADELVNGAGLAKELRQKGEKAGHSWPTLRRAKEMMNLSSIQKDGVWWWSLENEEDEEDM
jgi:hypothetical protein